MGVTIHFEGQLRSQAEFDQLLRTVESRALVNAWLTLSIETDPLTKGILVYINEDCDPVRLEFDPQLRIDEFVKTQFAGARVHRQIIGLFRELQPYFLRLNVDDEGEYWETQNEKALEKNIAR